MPRGRKQSGESDEESAFEPHGAEPSRDDTGSVFDDDDGDDDDDYDDDIDRRQKEEDESVDELGHNGAKQRAAAKDPKPRAPPNNRPPTKRKKKTYEIDEEEEKRPTKTRLTERGGYSLTNSAKAKISAANTGNVPWNLGKNRSSADRAKIAAGVKARNRVILLEKLKRWGMTEEEWDNKKKEVKKIRAKIQRVKATNAKQKESLVRLEEARKTAELEAQKELQEEKGGAENERLAKVKASREATSKKMAAAAREIFVPEVEWTPFSFSAGNELETTSYEDACPNGGVGGLICCEACSTKYSSYLTRTVQDLESHRAHKTAQEMKQIMEVLGDERKALDKAMAEAKTRLPPLPQRAIPQKKSAGTSGASKNQPPPGLEDPDILTNTMEMGDV